MPIARFTKKFIYVKFKREGIHAYPAALEDPRLKEVSFLGYPHRHIFHFKVTIEVFHDDRDIEFILFKRELEKLYDGPLASDHKSCEMFAEQLGEIILNRYPNRDLTVEVSEDDENGAILSWTAKAS